MLFTWSSKDLCIVFRQWRVTGPLSLVLSLIAIVLLAAGYECIREISRRYDQSHNAQMSAFSTNASSAYFPCHFLARQPSLRLSRPNERIKLIARCRKRIPDGSRTKGDYHQSSLICYPGLLQLLHHVGQLLFDVELRLTSCPGFCS